MSALATHVRLAPDNATAGELILAEVTDPYARLIDFCATIRQADRNPPPAWMPYYIAELGLGPLVAYLPNLYELVGEGIAWQRLAGTPAAVSKGVGWLGYDATFEYAPPRRRRWHLWQMRLSRLPDAERPDLGRIDGIASLSDDAVAEFWRGFRGYDVRAHEWGARRWGGAMWSRSSGVRLDGKGALWSFGRRHEAVMSLGETELTALSAWIPAVGESSAWSTMHVPWSELHYPWANPSAATRRASIVATLKAKDWHIVFRDGAGAVIGAARAFARPVVAALDGAYAFGAGRLAISGQPSALLVQARTPFDVAAGAAVADIVLAADAARVSGVKPGQAWLRPEDIDLTDAVVLSPPALAGLDIAMAATIREHTLVLLRIA